MKKEAELNLMLLVLAHGGRIPIDLWDCLTKPEYGYLAKWAHKGHWEYGVTLRSGWLTDEGKDAFKKCLDVR